MTKKATETFTARRLETAKRRIPPPGQFDRCLETIVDRLLPLIDYDDDGQDPERWDGFQ